ncbi:21354_t:CDS:2, partial [Racocetra persica]
MNDHVEAVIANNVNSNDTPASEITNVTSNSDDISEQDEKCQEISVTNRDDRQKNFLDPVIETKEYLSQERSGSESQNYNIYVFEESDEIELTKSQCIEQGLTKELLSSNVIVLPASSKITEHQSFQITTQSLICLFQNAIRARHEEILSWYYYSDSFENK